MNHSLSHNGLEAALARLRSLITALEDERDAESAALSHDIHDHLSQMLISVKFDLTWMQSNTTDPVLQKRISSALETTTLCIAEAQRLSSALHSGILEDLGISPSVEWLVGDFARRKISCSITQLDQVTGLGKNSEAALFRTLEESVTTLHKQGVTSCAIALRKTPDGAELTVSFEASAGPFSEVALTRWEERARRFTGSCVLESGGNNLTILRMQITQ